MENQLILPSDVMNALSPVVRSELTKMSNQKQEEFLYEFKRKTKSSGLGYLLWFFGLHYAYLGKWGLQIIYWITLGGLFLWWFIDLFRVGGLINDVNQDAAIEALRTIKAVS